MVAQNSDSIALDSPPMTTDTTFDTAVSLRRSPAFSDADLADLSRAFEGGGPHEVVGWACEAFGPRLVLSASFADTLLIHIAREIDPDIEIVFIDTGFHFAETLATVRRALEHYSLNLSVVHPNLEPADVWGSGVESCCGARRVAPLERFLAARADAWLSGLRRDDSSDRLSAPILGRDRRGVVKINPLASWTRPQLDRFARDNDILVNPLTSAGYSSIGCWPCTEPSTGDDLRSGRWSGSTKTECGLHQ